MASVKDLDALLSALKVDMDLWRGPEDTDEHRFDKLTLRAVRMREDLHGEEDLAAIITPLQTRLKAVYEAADKASNEAWRRDTSAAVRANSTWQQLCTLVRDAQRIESSLDEIIIFYRCSAEKFRDLYEDKRLMWQLTL
ncbi:hypothetical protein EXIGLDRAFT_763445 [Exidia glandulosa HHB12029]|uniref:Uncharacterized protein n=1 Tax=Exidia glandulosa HHB12029 TaxID=1314781 RepID=A0A165M0Q3_EXIGL|nr:hypothetical protein EXIGLDRAFT_763445 [Exidia glandulosa HHB12029]